MAEQRSITQLLLELGAGQGGVTDELMPLVYDELKRLAHRRLRAERPGHTLDTSDLAHEAYLKLVDQQQVKWQNRAHFFAIAATAMRRILVDYARARGSKKRSGAELTIATGAGLEIAAAGATLDLVALDEVLSRLSAHSERACKVVECRVFVGLSIEETGEALGVAPITVKRDWVLAKTWLRRELGRADK